MYMGKRSPNCAGLRLLARLFLRGSMRRCCAVQSRGGMGACQLPLWGRLTSGGAPATTGRGAVVPGTEKCGSCRHLTASAACSSACARRQKVFPGFLPLVRMGRKRHRPICQIQPLAYGPARGPDPGPHAHERPFRRDLASREKGQRAPRPRSSCVQPWARCAGLSRAAMPRETDPRRRIRGARTKPATETGTTQDGGAGPVVWADALWLRAHGRAQPARYASPATGDSPPQPQSVLRADSSTCTRVCHSGFLSSHKRLRNG